MKRKTFIDINGIIADSQSIIKMILTDRSDGKTTAAKCAALQSFYDSGKAAIFCRRWRDSEFTQDFFDTFTANIETAHPELLEGRKVEIKGSKKKGYHLYINDKKAISFVSLSTCGRQKSNFDYSTHKNIYIDEYIPLDNTYCKNEAELILELWRTVDRDHYENAVYIFGNRITYSNPIFKFFNIRSIVQGKFNRFQNGRLLVFMWSSKNNQSQLSNSPLDELTRGTDYEAYAHGGFMRDISALIGATHDKTPQFGIIHDGKKYGVYAANGSLVIDVLKANSNTTQLPFVCSQAETDGAIFLNISPLKNVLAIYKYSNRLKFATEIICDNLKTFYAAIR